MLIFFHSLVVYLPTDVFVIRGIPVFSDDMLDKIEADQKEFETENMFTMVYLNTVS